jgi:N-acetylmuramoyl-L-alanine amidase
MFMSKSGDIERGFAGEINLLPGEKTCPVAPSPADSALVMPRCLFPLAFALILAGLPAWGETAATTVRVHDQGYVRLTEWARWQGLDWRWLQRDESFQLVKSGARLQFSVDSREASFNGVQLWLLLPLARRNGEVYLSQLDVDATFRPLLSPPRNERGKKVRTICLDAGHGGKDPGNQVAGRQEKDYVLRLTLELRDQLRKAGFKVVLTRSTDKFLELSDRPAAGGRAGADLFLSLHFNSVGAGRNEASGSEVYALTPKGAASTNARGEGANAGPFPGNRQDERNLLLAWQIQKSLVGQLDSADRGVRRARFEVLREATMPAALIEAGFLSHPVEGKKIFTGEYRRQMAKAIVEGIRSYQRILER